MNLELCAPQMPPFIYISDPQNRSEPYSSNLEIARESEILSSQWTQQNIQGLFSVSDPWSEVWSQPYLVQAAYE